MAKNKKNFYITTSIAYANGRPHIGHALEMIQADIIARYMRKAGYNVFFGTGTDEHGDKISRTAFQNKKTTKQFVDETASVFKSQKKTLNISYDGFIRTSDKKKHWPGALKLWDNLVKNKDIYKKEYEGLYCVGCEKFLTEKDLVRGECVFHKQIPEKIKEENYFFRLSKYAYRLERAIAGNQIKILPEERKNEVLSFIREGLEDISFSRLQKSVPWGIPIPKSNQTMYVWCDALSNYISSVGYGRDYKTFQKWWPADIHLIGKDILRFHAVYWPAMLMSANLPLPKSILVHGFITVEGQKMSKSLGNVVDAVEASEKYGMDVLRYYMIRDISSFGDGDFSEKKIMTRYNNDLAKGLGNFISRSAHLFCGNKILASIPVSKEIKSEIAKTKLKVKKGIKEFRLHEALSSIFDLIGFGDKYINDNRPWENKNTKVSRNIMAIMLATGEELIPFMPETSEKIFKIFSVKNGNIIPKKTKPVFPQK